jgi:Fe-S oxidoreductase
MNYLKTKEHYDNCRFCWMCRQVCTVATMTNDETQSPRSRGLAMYAAEKGIVDLDSGFTEAMYKCCLCNYCNSWCEGDYDPQKFALAIRRDAVDMDIVPGNILHLKETIVETGNVFSEEISKDFKELWDTLPKKGDVVVLAGGVIPFRAVEMANAALSIFNKSGVQVAAIDDEITGAYELYCLGYYNIALETVKKLIKQIEETGAKTIVTLDTQERYFLSDLEELFGLKLVARVLDFSEFIVENAIVPTKDINKNVTYQDDSCLTRKCKKAEVPRNIISLVPGTKLIEMLWFKEEAHATPSALYNFMYNNIADKMIQRRIEDFKETQTEVLIVSSANDNYKFKQAGIPTISLAEYLDQAL